MCISGNRHSFLFLRFDNDALELGLKVARWTIENMQDKTGYFYFRQLPRIKAKTPMLHWGQATMYKALARLEMALVS